MTSKYDLNLSYLDSLGQSQPLLRYRPRQHHRYRLDIACVTRLSFTDVSMIGNYSPLFRDIAI